MLKYWPKVLILLLVAGGPLAGVFYAVQSSPGFRYCMDNQNQYPSANSADQIKGNKTPTILIPKSGAPQLWYCIGSFSNENGVAVTGFATVLLTVLTAVLGSLAYMQFTTSRAQLRAYVSASPNFIVAFDANAPPAVKYKIFNHGSTPAFSIRHRSEIEVLPHPYKKGMSLPKPSSDFSAAIVLFPNAESTGSKTRGRPFTVAEIAEIKNGQARVYVYGELEYRDIFGGQRSTTFCQAVIADAPTLKKLTSSYKPSDLTISFETASMGNSAT